MNIEKMIEEYTKMGYEYADASSKVCQDILLLKISNSSFREHITIKGGVVLHSISKNIRRATRDLDLDFIKYSLEDDSIRKFVDKLNQVKDNIEISIIGSIKRLHHQDYDGKRVNIRLSDSYNNSINTKLDIGIHKQFDIEQDEYCFSFDIIGKHANLLINSPEQILTEKLKSLLKLGFRSTRYKDLFDFYYLINIVGIDKKKVENCFNILIFNDTKMKENSITDIINRLNEILNSKRYFNMLNDPKVNWINLPINEVVDNILNYFKSLEVVKN
mgnify:CR=1 FL=1